MEVLKHLEVVGRVGRRQQLVAGVQLLAPDWRPVLIRVVANLGGPEPVHLPRRILLPQLRRRLLACSIQPGLNE